MGYCGSKIPGHSGTDFKHKKVFSKSIYNLKHEKLIANVKTEARDKVKSRAWFKYAHFIILLGFLSVFTIVVYFFLLRIEQTPHKNFYVFSTPKKVYSYDRNAQKVLYRSALLYYRSGAYNYAQDELVRLLKVNPGEMKNIELMHSILEKQCETKALFCKETVAYKRYLDLIQNCV